MSQMTFDDYEDCFRSDTTEWPNMPERLQERGLRELPPFKEKAFYDIFSENVYRFATPLLAMFGIWSFDIVRFEDWMKRNGYREDNKSLSDFIREEYGEKADKLINDLIHERPL